MTSALFHKYAERFGDALAPLPPFRDETAWRVDASIFSQLAACLKNEDDFHYLLDIASVDNLPQTPRFEVIYHLCRLADGVRLRLKICIEETSCELPSVAHLWRAADWHEREVYDMMGIKFTSHPDLRRILMWDGYPYYPLRKDFPLEGKPTEMPDVAFSEIIPLDGGPFVTSPAAAAADREPRAHPPKDF